MWDTVSNIAAIVVIILLFQLLGLPDWIEKLFKRRKTDFALSKKVDELEERIRTIEKKIK
jgi:hypothetical protein